MKTTTMAALGISLAAAAAALGGTTRAARPCPGPQVMDGMKDVAPVAQLAILLDTSNSMDGLIDQARSQLWKVVNEFSGARRYGRAVELQVALYEYGNNRIPTTRGYVRQVLPFTTDLDRVSEELFALTTNGGDEYCGTVIQAALDELRWSASPADLKVVFIAGNEPFSQGPVSYRSACSRARSKGVVVNTIHCGPREEGERTGWRDGAQLASGLFSAIDQDRKVAHVAAPQDPDIARLGTELNKTYVPFGLEGRSGQARQEEQDRNAAKSGVASATYRAVTKANRLYSNGAWDLVDAVRSGSVDLKLVKAGELPAELQAITPDLRKGYLEARARDRERIQAEINELNRERTRYVAGLSRSQATAEDSLDAAMAQALRQQAACAAIELQ